MILGINTSKSALYISECHYEDDIFSAKKVTKVAFNLNDSADLVQLLKTSTTLLTRNQSAPPTVAILKCVSGLRSSSIQAVKAEAMIQLAAMTLKLDIFELEPRSLKKLFKCGIKEKWMPIAKKSLDISDQIKYWSEGGAGAVAAAYAYSESGR